MAALAFIKSFHALIYKFFPQWYIYTLKWKVWQTLHSLATQHCIVLQAQGVKKNLSCKAAINAQFTYVKPIYASSVGDQKCILAVKKKNDDKYDDDEELR